MSRCDHAAASGVPWPPQRGARRSLSRLASLVCLLFVVHGGAALGHLDDLELSGPPLGGEPLAVRAWFDLHDINQIDDETEILDFAGVLTLEWRDPRRRFDPSEFGAAEKFYQGNFEFNDISPGWFPDVVLVNEAESQTSGLLLRVKPDGSVKLIQTITAEVDIDLDMRRFPLDRQRLEVEFEILGVGRDEVFLEPGNLGPIAISSSLRVPQWAVEGARLSSRERVASYAGGSGVASTLVLTIDVSRRSWYARRLIVVPLAVIVLLSFSVFWMEPSSLADRLSVSFIGILTGVAYQMTTSEQIPRISYYTLMHAFLGISFLTMSATVVINLLVGVADRAGDQARATRIDRRSRWLFPLAYFGLVGAMLAWEFLLP